MKSKFDIEFEKIMESAGMISPAEFYFISPSGKAIPGRDSVHIRTILKYPETFGLTMKDIDKVYKKYKETKEHEGKARNEIFLELMKKGWVRVRYYERNGMIMFQLFKMTNKVKENIWGFLEQTISKKIRLPRENINNADVRIINTEGDILFFGDIKNVMKKLYESNYVKKNKLIIEAWEF
jgi:hypothetical protein